MAASCLVGWYLVWWWFNGRGIEVWLILCVLRFGLVVDHGLDQWVLVDIQSFLVCCDTWRWLVIDCGFGGLL